jgi:hypothetical protein
MEDNKSKGQSSKELEKRLKEIEAALAHKQMEVDFLNKMLDLASKEYKTDLRKISGSPSNSKTPDKNKKDE